MPNFIATPWCLPSEQKLYFGDSIPTLATDVVGMNLQPGDMLWITSAAVGGLGAMFKCITAPNTTYPGGQWQEVAEGVKSVTSKSAAYTVNGNNDDRIVCTGGSGFQITLCSAVAFPNKEITVIRMGAGNGTVVCAGSDKMGNNHTTATFAADESAVTLVSDGVEWQVSNRSGTVNLS
jgi:hypothetical protein